MRERRTGVPAQFQKTNRDPCVSQRERQKRFQRLFKLHRVRLCAWLCDIVGDPAEAEEVAQEAFLRLFRHWGEIEPTKRVSWLFRVASNLGKNARRGRQRRRRWHLAASEGSAPSSSCDPLQNIAIQAAFSRLSRRQAMLLCSYARGLSHQELAKTIGVRKSSLSQLLLRARHALAHGLGEV